MHPTHPLRPLQAERASSSCDQPLTAAVRLKAQAPEAQGPLLLVADKRSSMAQYRKRGTACQGQASIPIARMLDDLMSWWQYASDGIS